MAYRIAMTATWTTQQRIPGARMVAFLLVLSFLFIPVRCDASAAPHSIFVSPNALAVQDPHAHHHGVAAQTDQSRMAVHHHHGMTSKNMDSSDRDVDAATSPTQQPGALSLAGANDPESQQPVGAALDLPTTPVTASSSTLLPLEGEVLLVFTEIRSIPGGISSQPDDPPPKFA